METPTYIALSRQMVLRDQMEVVANNLANANTSGFKAEMMLMSEVEIPAEKGTALSYVQDFATARDFSPGTLRPTGNDLDLAIQGDGFFAVQTPEGVRYTRVGRFQVDQDGMLVTSHGYPVLASGGSVTTTSTTRARSRRPRRPARSRSACWKIRTSTRSWK
jgi:flagellar basal-body rod protein FlgF